MNSIAVKKEKGLNNPIIAQRFMADPYAIEYEGTIYVYGSNDSGSLHKDDNGNYYRNSYANIKSINCISSDDMVNWTDHGIIQVASDDRSERVGIAKWASNSWAPAACYNTVTNPETGEKQLMFFLYFANSAANIGVLVSESPVGPWRDPLGKPMITRETPGCDGVEWLFDPAVLVDDNGDAYIYFGGGVPEGKQKAPGTARVAKLGKDMISIDGEAVKIDAPYIFEDSGINKIGDTYYYSYCTNWSEEAGEAMGKAQISYMTSKNPMGPFEYQGEIMQNPGQSEYFSQKAWGNNHHCILGYKGKHYMFYHTPQYEIDIDLKLEDAPDKCAYRTTYVDMVTVAGDGTLHVNKMTKTGTAAQLKNVNPFKETKAAEFVWGEGVSTEPKNIRPENRKAEMDMSLCLMDKQGWIGLSGVDFSTEECKDITVKAASDTDCEVKFYIDQISAENILGKVNVTKTGSMDDYSVFKGDISMDCKGMKGVHDLFITFDCDACGKVLMDSWIFG